MVDKIKPLTKKQLETLKEKLLDEKKSILASDTIANLDLSLIASEGSDEVDQSISDYANSHYLRFKNREVIYLKKIDKALKKFDLNEYGLCNDCGCQIRFERLLARPTADLCILCKEEAERDESSNIIGKQSKSLGRVVDLTGILA